MKFIRYHLLIILFSCFTYSQQSVQVNKIEDFILNKKLDSALIYISKQKDIRPSDYLSALKRVTISKGSYKDYYTFVLNIAFNRDNGDFNKLSRFIKELPDPQKSKHINLDFVYLKWLFITKLRDKGAIRQASLQYNKLEKYTKSFDNNEVSSIKANLLLQTHKIVLLLIENKVKKGKKLCISGLKKSEKLEDPILQIIYLNTLCDFLIAERNLDAYITKSEKSFDLEKTLQNKSPFYASTLIKLIDAYMYKGGHTKRVITLLNTLYNSPNRIQSYSLFANFLRYFDEKSPFTKTVFNRFGVKDYISFCKKIYQESKDVLNSNSFYFVLNQSAKLLKSKGFLSEAYDYESESVGLTRKIYSEDLATSLANFQTEQAVKEKELEIAHEKEKSDLYGIISILAILILAFLLTIILKMIKQQKLLKEKNIEIAKQRDAIVLKEKEKGLLLKEVHHRVKNNFQIVSSLLELQTKDIEDEKALNLANDGKNRIKSMALIHQKLYQNETGLVDFDEYVHLLVQELSTVYASNKNIKTIINSKNMQFDIDTAIPLGLIINELVTNAYKYAFKTSGNHILNITIKKENKAFYKLTVSDNGPGLKKDINLEKIKSLGLRLVTRLTKQLQGSVTQINKNGAVFEILFKDTALRKQLN
ncbi:MAG: sensor histidine kinase [Flavobacteriaceae bacterium]|nr:sensor histidine kinase [Flavobacteriaceae bacterium]